MSEQMGNFRFPTDRLGARDLTEIGQSNSLRPEASFVLNLIQKMFRRLNYETLEQGVCE